MNVQDIISSGILELYATGLALPEEVLQVQQWAAQYPEVADELAQIEAGLAIYAQANAAPPAPAVKEKILERISNQEKAQVIPDIRPLADTGTGKVVGISSAWKRVAAAAIVLLAGSAVLNLVQYNSNKNKDAALLEKDSVLKETLAVNDSLQQKGKGMADYVEVARNPDSRSIAVNVANAPDSSAKVFWMQHNGDVYVDPSNLPSLPGDKQYELWAIVDGVPVNAGIIITTDKGKTYRVQPMKSFGNVKVQAFAVSIEPRNTRPAEKPTVVYAVGPTI